MVTLRRVKFSTLYSFSFACDPRNNTRDYYHRVGSNTPVAITRSFVGGITEARASLLVGPFTVVLSETQFDAFVRPR